MHRDTHREDCATFLAIPDLIAEVERLRDQNARIRERLGWDESVYLATRINDYERLRAIEAALVARIPRYSGWHRAMLEAIGRGEGPA